MAKMSEKMFEKMFEKMSKMDVVLLWIHFLRQVGYMLENFQIFWNYTTHGKKIVNRKEREYFKIQKF